MTRPNPKPISESQLNTIKNIKILHQKKDAKY